LVFLKAGVEGSSSLMGELNLIRGMWQKIGRIARPDEILFAAELPKTRSGKIMRLLRDIADRRAWGTPQRLRTRRWLPI
jgi:acetyl-CoA synthetase